MHIPANINEELLNVARVAAALGALVLVGRYFFRRPSRPPTAPGKPPPKPAATVKPPASTPWGRAATPNRPELAALEAQLRLAILSASAREGLIADAMKKTGNDRAAAIRKVLEDLPRENERWS